MSASPTASVAFAPGSSFAKSLYVTAALGDGPPHKFVLDTGSVGVLAPRSILGPGFQTFDSDDDIAFGFVSSGKSYQGQWVQVQVVLGVPPDWDGTGDYPIAEIDVFAVDQPAEFDGGVFGVGFGIGDQADGGPARNPLLNIFYQGERLKHGYIIGAQGLEIGLNASNMQGFAFLPLERGDDDWTQPLASYSVSGVVSTAALAGELPLLVDTGISHMILWLSGDHPAWPSGVAFPAGVSVTVSAPSEGAPALSYSFATGDGGSPMAPAFVEWRVGEGLNTGLHALASDDYLYDATVGRIGFRSRPVAP